MVVRSRLRSVKRSMRRPRGACQAFFLVLLARPRGTRIVGNRARARALTISAGPPGPRLPSRDAAPARLTDSPGRRLPIRPRSRRAYRFGRACALAQVRNRTPVRFGAGPAGPARESGLKTLKKALTQFSKFHSSQFFYKLRARRFIRALTQLLEVHSRLSNNHHNHERPNASSWFVL